MNTTDITLLLNRIEDLKNRYSGRRLTTEDYTDEETGFIGIRILDEDNNTIDVVEPQYSIVDGVAVETFSPHSIVAEINYILNN